MSTNAASVLAGLALDDALADLRDRGLEELMSSDMPLGLPRPRMQVPGYENGPAPYVAGSVSQPGTLDMARSIAVEKAFLCVICGLGVTDPRCGIATGTPVDETDADLLTINGDHGLSHEKCARMTVAWCPAFNGHPDLAPLIMWLVDTDTLRATWHRLNADLTLGLLGRREQVEVPPRARRPWAA